MVVLRLTIEPYVGEDGEDRPSSNSTVGDEEDAGTAADDNHRRHECEVRGVDVTVVVPV